MNRYLDDDESESSFDDDIDIHEIVRVGTFEEVKEAIAIDRPRLIALKDEFKRTALHYAAELDRIKVAVFLIAKQANVNAADDRDQTPLHIACAKGLTEMARTLLEFNANIKLRDKNCCTALHLAAEGNYLETATLLVKRGVDVNAEEYRYGRTALHIAAEKGYTELATMLLIRGADMYASGDKFYSRTPLHLACIEGHTEVVRVLVKRGADVSVLSGFLDMDPLHLACEHGHWEAAEILINKGMDLDTCGNHINGSTPLHICAQLNRLAIMQILIEKGANLEKLGRFSTIGTPLHVACAHGHAHAAHLLVQHGADRNARDETGHTPLHHACKSGQYDCAFMLIDLEADVTVRAENGKIAFDYIAVPTIKEKILTLSAEVQRRIEARREAERLAAEAERERQRREAERLERLRLEEEERIRQAVRRTAEFTRALRSVADISGELSALLGVAEHYPDQDVNVNIIHPTTEYRSEKFQYAVENDYDLDSLTGTVHSHTTVGTEYEVYRIVNGLYDSSALTRAALRGFVDVVQGLLQWPGVNINYQESNGNTALHNAALIGSREIVEMLLLAGANLTVLNRDGKVAANLARTNYLREIIRNPRLMTTRAHYQERVMDHLFLRQRCQLGQALTVAEATVVNQVVEYTPVVGHSQAEPPLQLATEVGPAVVPALALDSVDAGGSPPPHQSKYYKPPKRKATDLHLHQASAASQASAHSTGIGALKSILKPANEGNTLTAPPVVVFTPSTVPPELAHLFPHSAMAVPAHVQSALLLENSWMDGTVRTEPPSAPAIYNNTRAVPATASAVRADPVIDNILRKHGPLPGKFGGCESDFFALQANTAAQLSPPAQSQQQRSAKDTMFLDLLTLQRSYVPSAFDTTDEWNEIRDFLWLLGEPFKPTKINADEEGRTSASGRVQDGQQCGGAHSASADDDASLCSGLTDHHQAQNAQHLSGQRQPPRYVPFLQYQVTADRRYFLYRLAVTMNNIQATFTTTDYDQQQQQQQQQQLMPRRPSPRGEKAEPRTAGSQSKNNHNHSGGGLPRIPASPGKNIGRKDTEDGSKAPAFLSSPVAQIKRALSLESNIIRDEASMAESKLPVDAALDWSRMPKNLSRTDVYRLVRFTQHCEEYVQWVLQLYAPKDYGWPNEMLDSEGGLVTECVRYNVMYLQYYGLATAPIEEHLLNLVDLSYTAVFLDPPASASAAHSQGQLGATGVTGQRTVSFAEPSQQSLTAGDHYSAGQATSSAGPRRRAPDLLHNPPRYLRLAVDAVYEVSEFIKLRAEQGYPTDSVRAHLLAQAGRAVIAQQCTLAAQQVPERGVNSMVSTGLSPLPQRAGAEVSADAVLSTTTTAMAVTVPHHGAETTAVVPRTAPRAAHSVPQAAQVACRRWLTDLLLIDYEPYFQHQGFRLLSDFAGLTEQDCFEYFPFLKAGDLRRLARAAPLLTDDIIAQYAADV